MIKRLLISGRVQGVGYRASFYYAAKRAGVTGWIRNRRDGSVEAVISGEPAVIDQMVEWARQGPDLARVERVAVSDGDGAFVEFTIEDTLE